MNGRDSEIEGLPEAGPYLESDRIALVDIGRSEMPLSSSALRAQRRCDDPSWLTGTTPDICQYIVDHSLYHSI